MAKAVIARRKTQTRRVIRFPKATKHLRFNAEIAHPGSFSAELGYMWVPYRHKSETDYPWKDCAMQRHYSPYGDPALSVGTYSSPADRLRVLTTWAVRDEFDHLKPTRLNFSKTQFWHAGMSEHKPAWAGRLRPGRFLPLAQRVRMPLLEVKAIRPERIQAISEDDAVAEGIMRNEPIGEPWSAVEHGWMPYCSHHPNGCDCHPAFDPRKAFLKLFYGIRRRAAVSENPWVWVVTFRLLAESGEVAV